MRDYNSFLPYSTSGTQKLSIAKNWATSYHCFSTCQMPFHNASQCHCPMSIHCFCDEMFDHLQLLLCDATLCNQSWSLAGFHTDNKAAIICQVPEFSLVSLSSKWIRVNFYVCLIRSVTLTSVFWSVISVHWDCKPPKWEYGQFRLRVSGQLTSTTQLWCIVIPRCRSTIYVNVYQYIHY